MNLCNSRQNNVIFLQLTISRQCQFTLHHIFLYYHQATISITIGVISMSGFKTHLKCVEKGDSKLSVIYHDQEVQFLYGP